MVTHPGQKRKLCLAAHHGNCTPPRISPSCPFRDRSTNAGAVIARQIGHDLLSGRSDPLPTLSAAFMQSSCTGGSSRSLQCRCPFSVFTRHTSGCISASGYALYKVQVEKYSPFQYYAGIEHNSMTDSQKLPIKFIKNLSFDSVFLCFRLTPDWDIFTFRAYSVSRIPSK